MLSNWVTRIISIILAVVFCNTHATSNIYKWTDKNGQIHYEEKPHKEFNNKTISLKNKNQLTESLVIEKPVKIEEQEVNGVTKYFLLANERINKFAQKPTTLVINNNKLWLTFEHSVLSFDLLKRQSRKYNLKKLQDLVSTQNMYFSDDKFIFLGNEKKSSERIFHVYNHKTKKYKKWPTSKALNGIILSENSEDLLVIDDSNSTLSLFNNLDDFNEKYITRFTVNVPLNLTNNPDTIWYTYSIKPYGKTTCSVGYFFKNKSKSVTFNHKEIGFPELNTCGWIVSDDDEVWVTSNSRKKGSVFAVYSINDNKWDSLAVSENGLPVNQSHLQIDSNNLYYYSCDNLIALNRESRNASVIDTNVFDGDEKHRYCIYNYKLYKNQLWVLKFEPYKYKTTPVLYKIPISMFDKEIVEYYKK